MSKKILAFLCVILLLLSLLPVYGLSFFNHPFYDDFGFSIKPHAAWRNTGSHMAVLRAAWENTLGTRNTWEGTYTTTFLSGLQPGVWGEDHYWIGTFVLVTGLLLALGFFLWQVLGKTLHADAPTVIIAFCGLAFLMVQLAPSPSEAFFWFNGGVAYTFLWSLLLLTAGCWLAYARLKTRGKSAALFALLLVLAVLLGGGKYSMVLVALLLALAFTLLAFVRRHPKRLAFAMLTLVLLLCLAFSASAPGNAVRAKTLQGGLSAPMAVAQALYFGLALMGHWFSLPLLAVALILTWLLLPTLRRNSAAFAHPLWVTLAALCLFCAQLAPTLYTGNFLGDGRVMNTYYYSYCLMVCGLATYWAGFLLSRNTGIQPEPSPRVSLPVLALAAVLLVVGMAAYRPQGRESYGPQNSTAGTAVFSLLKGEAQAYDRQMDTRDAAMNDPAQTTVALRPVDPVPKVFMGDAADSQAIDYVLSLYAEYYRKESVTLVPKE
ncbi:MAG: hypothetical protein GXY67_08480 [Clostridiales bacterium]|nr:hypothetical protein [Clostridiales bacterium]